MMPRKEGIRLRIKDILASAALGAVYSENVPQGFIWCLESIAWEINKVTSGGNTRARLYIYGHGYKHFLDEQQDPQADWLYTRNEKDYLYPGERLALEIDQAQASTTVEMDITGYRETDKGN